MTIFYPWRIAFDQTPSLSVATAYQRAVQLWLDFCRHSPHHRHRSLSRRSGVSDVDHCVYLFLAAIHREGSGRRRQLAVNTVYGLYYKHPDIRGQGLRLSEQLLRGWARDRPSVSHPPLTWPLTTLLAVTMAMNGYADGALASLVSFDGLLRISEMTALRIRDVSAPSDPRRGRVSRPTDSGDSSSSGHVLLRLAVTKTGSNKWVELTDPAVEALLLQHIQGRPGDDRVFRLLPPAHTSTSSSASYRHAFRLVCRGLGLEDLHFTPHSLRHGGATHALQHLHQSVETVMLRGRWQSMASCRTYIQAGRAQLLQLSVPSSILSLAQAVAGDWYTTVCSALVPAHP